MMNGTTGYDPDRETYHAGFDWPGTKPPSIALVEAMAAVTDADPMNLDSLYETIDPDALDDLFGHRPFGSSGFDGSVTFAFCGHEVSIHASGEIVIDLSEF